MEFLNKAASQATDLFKGMTPASRLTAGMLLVLIVTSFVYLLTYGGGKADRYLYGGQEFSDQDIAKIADAFALEKLDDYDYDGRRIRVPGKKFSQYMQALSRAGFSPSPLEDFASKDSTSIFSSEEDKKRQDTEYEQLKLGRVISKRPDVDWATVQYQEVKERGFPPKTNRSVAVVVCGTGNQPLSESTLASIRANAATWFGVDKLDVGIDDINGSGLVQGVPSNGIDPEADKYLLAKIKIEEHFRNKILSCLRYIGPRVVAAVNVELDPTTTFEQESITVDPQKKVTLESETYEKTSDSRPAEGGRPGAQPNEVQGNEPRTLVTSNQQQSKMDESRELQSSVAGHEQTHQTKAAFVPTMVTASVQIPRSYFRDVWLEEKRVATNNENPDPPTIEEIDAMEQKLIPQIQENIKNTLIPLEAGEDQYPHIKVSSYQDLPPDEPEPASFATLALTWFTDNWKTMGLFAIGLVSLFVLRSMLKTSDFEAPSAASQGAAPEVADSEEEEPEEEPHVTLHRKQHPSGMSLREELISMVRDDPDAAANVLRTWIGDAA